MQRRAFLGALAAGMCGSTAASWAQPPAAGLISQIEAQRHGLRRSWITQVQLDRSRDRMANLLLDGPTLFAQTDQGLIHAIDAENGGTLWVTQVGRRGFPSSAPAVNEKYLAVVNGSTLHMLDRANGHSVWERSLVHLPSGSVAMSKDWVYSPSITGQLEVLNVDDPIGRKWNNASFGRIDISPLVTPTNVIWGTAQGYIYFCSLDRSNITFRLDTGGPITAALGYWPPIVYAASRDGYLYAIHEGTGERLWRFSLGTAVNRTPLAVEGAVYVMPDTGGMHALNCLDGTVRWFAPRAQELVAASEAHVYVADRFGDILVLDAKTGGQFDLIPAAALKLKYTNIQNDRLYLSNTTGMLLCMHEPALKTPLVHQLPEPEGTEPKTKQEGAPPPADENAAPKDDVFGK